ncbi:MAG: hypothetical protein WCG05_01070 [Alphaproteobacteria bacterium]
MTKKFILPLLIAGLPFAVFADKAHHHKAGSADKSGFYAGLGLTYTKTPVTRFGVYASDLLGGVAGYDTVRLAGKSKIGGAFMAGYHYRPESWGNYFLEGEFLARVTNNKLKNGKADVKSNTNPPNSYIFSLSIKQKETYGALLRIGSYLTECFGLYGSVGAVNTKFQTSVYGQGTIPADNIGSTKTTRVWGTRFGGGLIQGLNDDGALSLKLDYGYEMYQAYSTGPLLAYNDRVATNLSASMSPNLASHVLTLSLNYKI